METGSSSSLCSLGPNDFFLVGAWKVLSAIRASEPGGDLDNQSFNSSLELLCCVRAVYIWIVVFVLFCLFLCFLFAKDTAQG